MRKDYEWYDLSRYRTELYGVAILWIMLFHFKGTYPVWAKAFLSFGNMGVELFLFASGVSLCFAMQKKEPLSVFYRRRFLRLLVPVIVICSWEWIPMLLKGKISFPVLLSRWTSLDFWLTGRQQTWFISFLLVAYLLYPLIYRFLYGGGGNPSVRGAFLMAGAVAAALIIRRYAPAYYDKTEIALTRFPVFLLGCAAGKTVYEKKTVKDGKPWMIPVLALTALASVAVMGLKLVGDGMPRRYFYLIPGVALSLLVPALVSLLRSPLKLLWTALRALGERSLELYLLHVMLMLAACVLLSFPAHFIVGKLSGLLGGGKRREPEPSGDPGPGAEPDDPQTP